MPTLALFAFGMLKLTSRMFASRSGEVGALAAVRDLLILTANVPHCLSGFVFACREQWQGGDLIPNYPTRCLKASLR